MLHSLSANFTGCITKRRFSIFQLNKILKETSPPKSFFPRLVKLVCPGALFFLGNGYIALILDTEWEHQAEALVRGDPSETLFLGFFSPFSSFFLFLCN